jgi:hypothetical protein
MEQASPPETGSLQNKTRKEVMMPENMRTTTELSILERDCHSRR